MVQCGVLPERADSPLEPLPCLRNSPCGVPPTGGLLPLLLDMEFHGTFGLVFCGEPFSRNISSLWVLPLAEVTKCLSNPSHPMRFEFRRFSFNGELLGFSH